MSSLLTAGAASAAVLSVAVLCTGASSRNGEGPAGACVRVLATLMLPASALGFVHLYSWWLALAASLVFAAAQWRVASARGRPPVPLPADPFWLLPAGVTGLMLAVKAALALGSTPYDIDSIAYHLPMAIAFLQTHAVAPAQVMFDPGGSELFDSLGLGALGAVGGQTLTEGVVAFALFLAACGFAERVGASRAVAIGAGCAALAMPMAGDQIFTAQNDLLVGTLLLAFVALWSSSPMLAAIAAGLAAGTKFTGAVETAVLLPILWNQRSALLSWRQPLVAFAVAAPWYARNAVQTGNPFFLGGQTTGFSSTIAAHLIPSAHFVLSAIRNYGGLLAVAGVAGVVLLRRDADSGRPLARVLPYLALANLLLWLVIPNSAGNDGAALNQILSGWSIRYAIFGLAVLNVGAVVWLARFGEKLALTVVALVAAATALREWRFALHVDPGAMAFVLPCALALVLAVVCLVPGRAARGALAGVLAVAIFAFAENAGASRIASVWDARYGGSQVLGVRYALAPALASGAVLDAAAIGTIETPPLPLIGPGLQRYALADEDRLAVDAWWIALRAARPQAIVASPLRDGTASANEVRLRDSGLYRLAYGSPLVRVYVPAVRP